MVAFPRELRLAPAAFAPPDGVPGQTTVGDMVAVEETVCLNRENVVLFIMVVNPAGTDGRPPWELVWNNRAVEVATMGAPDTEREFAPGTEYTTLEKEFSKDGFTPDSV